MGIVSEIRKLGFGYVFERVFERIVPAWMFRFCSLAVYQIDSSKLSGGPFSNADIKICDNAQELDELRTVTYACLLYTSPSPRDRTRSRMPSSA